MPESQIALPPGNIFLLDKDKPFADTSIETWITVMSMFYDLDSQFIDQYPPEYDRQILADELCRKHPFLKFTKEKPNPGNPYWELGARVYVWNAAFDALGYRQFKQEHDYFSWYQRGLQENINKLSQGDYELLWNPYWFLQVEKLFTLNVYDEVFWDRPEISNQKTLLLRRYAYGELWAFTQRLKLQELTSAQEQDRQKLELWTISRIKETLIAYELEPACASEIDDSDVEPENVYYKHKENPTQMEFFLKAQAIATRIVERRIAKGNWQVRGRHVHKYKFKFNGIETDTSCCEQESKTLN